MNCLSIKTVLYVIMKFYFYICIICLILASETTFSKGVSLAGSSDIMLSPESLLADKELENEMLVLNLIEKGQVSYASNDGQEFIFKLIDFDDSSFDTYTLQVFLGNLKNTSLKNSFHENEMVGYVHIEGNKLDKGPIDHIGLKVHDLFQNNKNNDRMYSGVGRTLLSLAMRINRIRDYDNIKDGKHVRFSVVSAIDGAAGFYKKLNFYRDEEMIDKLQNDYSAEKDNMLKQILRNSLRDLKHLFFFDLNQDLALFPEIAIENRKINKLSNSISSVNNYNVST